MNKDYIPYIYLYLLVLVTGLFSISIIVYGQTIKANLDLYQSDYFEIYGKYEHIPFSKDNDYQINEWVDPLGNTGYEIIKRTLSSFETATGTVEYYIYEKI